MKTRTFPYFIAVIALVAIAAFATWYFKHAAQQPGVATATSMASTTEYTVDISYPQFGIPAIDSQIKADVVAGENDLITQANTDKPAENRYPQYAYTCAFNQPSIGANYAPYIGSDYISVAVVCAPYTGGAHENPVVMGETFDRSTGKRVTLDQALSLTGMTLSQIASSSKAQLAQNPDTAPTGIWASGSDPTSDNYSTFLINQDAVTFIFQPYQVAPYSSGAPEVSIPRVK